MPSGRPSGRRSGPTWRASSKAPARIMSEAKSCCTPSMPGGTQRAAAAAEVAAGVGGHDVSDMVLVPGGAFRMGCDRREGHPSDGEGPSRLVEVAPFLIDTMTVSNVRFARF